MKRAPLLFLVAALAACGGKAAAPPADVEDPESAGKLLPASVPITDDINIHIDHLTHTSGGIQVDGWAYIEKAGARGSEVSVVLRSPDGAHLAFKGWPVARRDVSEHFKNPDLDDSGFSAWIPRSTVASGDYLLGVYIRRPERESLEITEQVIHID